ncbi:purine/pyrimidine permease [Exiguobacterium sp. RIT594]|uniref:purine/pyrimidine permease n=1 Tax=Exiguobacterium sp. RIT594 TaxID=2282449 RepID=UPI000DF858F9|nr:purine/pyrimidine permease [Exiguobacterium sp. RIT594]RDB34508.1 xanthine permease [Exiguobacterium sp. RIT594]
MKRTTSTVQWIIFLLANTIALPIVVASLFDLSSVETAALVQRSFFVGGIACFLHGTFGHRLPIVSGPAGSWVSIFVVIAALPVDSKTAFTIAMAAVVIAGIVLIFLGLTGWTRFLLPVFTPLVSGTFLLLLCIQLTGVMLGAVLAVEATRLAGMLTFLLVLGLSQFGPARLRPFALMIGIVVGWLVSRPSLPEASGVFAVPTALPFGMPQFDGSAFLVAIPFAILLIVNLIAALSAVEATIQKKGALNQGLTIEGIIHLIAATFSTLVPVPLPITSGFIAQTGSKERRPFLIASLVIALIGFFPSIIGIIATLPRSVASAALLATLPHMFLIAWQSAESSMTTSRRKHAFAICAVIGISILLQSTVLAEILPLTLRPFFSNGLLIGTMLVLGFEVIERLRSRRDAKSDRLAS